MPANDNVHSNFEVFPQGDYPADEVFQEVGERVFAALTEADRAHLKYAIEDAIRAAREYYGVDEDEPWTVPEGEGSDDWLCALGNAECWNGWEGPVNDAVLLDVCRVLGRAKAHWGTDESRWGRLLSGAFDTQDAEGEVINAKARRRISQADEAAKERIDALYSSIQLGAVRRSV
jgi:hypothetical protein